MPRTSAVELPGCPPLRALTTDILGLVKVVEARGKSSIPKVVDTWGPPDASRAVVASSFADHDSRPLVAVARKNNLVEILNPLNGDAIAAFKVGETSSLENYVEEDPIAGLHLLKTKRDELSSRSNVLLLCTVKGKASLRSIVTGDASPNSAVTDSQSNWNVCASGTVICSSVNADEKFALFGGKSVEVNVWDLDNCSKIWTAKPPPSNSLGIFSPTWFTAATFLSKGDERKIAAGTNNHQIRLYDISAQRRPVISVSFRETPIKAVAGDPDGYTLYAGTGSGDLACFDMRTGRLVACFVGKCSGSIRSIARHPELPILASCGLDSYLRIWDTQTRQLLSAVFLKQHLTTVAIDSHFTHEECGHNSTEQSVDVPVTEHIEADEDDDNDIDDELLHSLRSTKQKKKDRGHPKSKTKKSKKAKREDNEMGADTHSQELSEVDDAEELLALKRWKSSSEEKLRSKRVEKMKSKRGSNVD